MTSTSLFFPSVCGHRHRPIFFCASVFLFTSHFSSLHFTCSLLSFFSSMFSFVYPLPLRCLYFSFSPCSPPPSPYLSLSRRRCAERGRDGEPERRRYSRGKNGRDKLDKKEGEMRRDGGRDWERGKRKVERQSQHLSLKLMGNVTSYGVATEKEGGSQDGSLQPRWF